MTKTLLLILFVCLTSFSESLSQGIKREVKEYFLAVYDQNTECGKALLRKDTVINQQNITIKSLVVTIDSLKADNLGYKRSEAAFRERDSLRVDQVKDARRREKKANTTAEVSIGLAAVITLISLLRD